ncbi:MAG: putative facilitator of salicylate uptake [uncultured Thiotrichaceae bacterium]|uniref:Putative facilitator of salicylate uptake n=1 Tax=uncultured Thiotrichaceae bacterium TaxID=298394 RepID=A0A6S6UL54_9GAMM|nr:MAG: putative facilitator of salicylate uptake [uncultured Thiotrichaceae bacterium]
MKQLSLSVSVALVCAGICTPQISQATNGYASHGFGTVQKAMGGAAVAGSDNAMNIATNPAAMSFGSNNWTAGLDIFKPDRETSGSPRGTFDGNGDEIFPIPEFGYQRHLNDKYAVGIAVYGNGGMNATYDVPIYSLAGTNTGIDFAQLFVAPSVSMKMNEKHSIGASLNLVYQRIEITGVDGFATASSNPGSLSDRGYDTSTGAGVTVGWQGKLSPRLAAGLAYRSKTAMSEFDDYSGLLAEQGDFDIPSMITAGVSLKATPETTLALDVARINYTDVKSISNPNNTAGIPTGGALLGQDGGAGFGWEDQNIVKLGVKHKLNEKMTLLAGYNHGKAPIPESETAFNVLAPATVEDHLTLGMDWRVSNDSNVTVQYMHAFENEIKGDGSPGSLFEGGAATADLKMKQDSIGIAYTKNFK